MDKERKRLAEIDALAARMQSSSSVDELSKDDQAMMMGVMANILTPSNSRDTQFAGFAKLLFDELNNNALITLADHPDFDRVIELQDKIDTLTKQIIAHRAYDFALHIAGQVSPYYADIANEFYECINNMADITTWPDERSE